MTGASAVPGVVVGLGRGGATDGLVRWAAEEAALRDVPLTLVHAWSAPVEVSVPLSDCSLPELVSEATAVAAPGSPLGVLLAQNADLLVLGGTGRDRQPSRTIRGCQHQATCPVVVVCDPPARPRGRVVAGMCATPASDRALRFAAEEAQLRHAQLVVVHAWQLLSAGARTGQEALWRAREIEQRLGSRVQEVLGEVDLDIELQSTHGPPLETLVEVSSGADVLVLGRGTHAGFRGLLHGAVGQDVIGLAGCPVVVVPGEVTALR